MYNIIRLFQSGKTKFSTIAFGVKPRIIATGATYTKVKQIQDAVVRVHPRANKKLYVGRALRYFRRSLLRKLSRGVPRVVITILQGSSSDNFRGMRGIIAGSNIKLISIGEKLGVDRYFVLSNFIFIIITIIQCSHGIDVDCRLTPRYQAKSLGFRSPVLFLEFLQFLTGKLSVKVTCYNLF